MSKSKENISCKQVLDYMMNQNKPFSAGDILANIKVDCGKTAVTRILDKLVSEQKILEKTYGKQKVYYVNQNLFPETKDTDLQNMDSQLLELSNELNGLQKEIKKFDDVIGTLGKSLTTEEAQLELSCAKIEILQQKDKLRMLESKAGHVKPDEKEKIYQNKEKYVKEYTRRKRITNDVIDAILEGYPKSKKHLLDEIGVDLNL